MNPFNILDDLIEFVSANLSKHSWESREYTQQELVEIMKGVAQKSKITRERWMEIFDMLKNSDDDHIVSVHTGDFMNMRCKSNVGILKSEIVKKFSLNAIEKDVFFNYIDYMNKESKVMFLTKVLACDRSYIDKFLDTDLNDIGEKIFNEKIDYMGSRKRHVDMYNLNNPGQGNNRILLYRGVLHKISTLPKEKRHKIYKKYFGVKMTNSPHKNRQLVYNGFISYIENLSKPQLKTFIDDTWDKNINPLKLFKS